MQRSLLYSLVMLTLAVPLAAQAATPAKRKPGPTTRKAVVAPAKADSTAAPAATASARTAPDPAPLTQGSTTSGGAASSSPPSTGVANAGRPTTGTMPSAADPITIRNQRRWWWEAAGGIGSQRFSCSVCATDRTTGGIYEVAGGLVFRPGLDFGGHVALFRGSRDGARQEVWRFGPALRWFPNPRSPFELRASLDLLRYRARPLNEPVPNPGSHVKSDAVSLAIGVGYQFPVTSGLAIAPFGELVVGAGADVIQGSAVQRSASATVIQAGLALRSR